MTLWLDWEIEITVPLEQQALIPSMTNQSLCTSRTGCRTARPVINAPPSFIALTVIGASARPERPDGGSIASSGPPYVPSTRQRVLPGEATAQKSEIRKGLAVERP